MTRGLCLALPTPGFLSPFDRPLLSRLPPYLWDNQHLGSPGGHASTPRPCKWALGQLLTWLQVANCQMCARACTEALPARKPSRANKREVLRVQQGALLYLSFSSTAAWQGFSKDHWEALAKICRPSDCLPGDTTSCLRKMPHGNSTTLCPSSSSMPPQWTSLGSHLFPGASEDGLPTKEDCAGCRNCLILEDNRYM